MPSLAIWSLAIWSLGCSLGTFENDLCSTHDECRGAFGRGSVCNADGFCESAKRHPRCNDSYPGDLLDNADKYQDWIVFGLLMDRSTANQEARVRSALLAAIGVNEEGGLDGRKIGLVICTNEENPAFDDSSIVDAGASVAVYLADKLGLPAIIGPSGSSNATAAFTSVRKYGTLVISPSATSDALTNLDHQDVSDENPGLLWRTAPPDSFQGSVIVADMIDRGIQNVAVIHEVDAYGDGLANRINGGLLAAGGNVTLHPWTTENERAEQIVQVANGAAEEVVFIASNKDDNVAFLLGAGATPGYDTKTFFLPDAGANQDIFDEAGAASGIFDRIRGTRPEPLGAAFAYLTYVAAYSAEYNEDVTQYSWTAQTFDAAWLVFYGSAWSQFRNGSITGKGIGWGLRKISCLSDGFTQPCNPAPIDIIATNWAGIVEQFRAGTAIDISGASGELNYDLATEETSAPIQIWVLVDGEIDPAP